MLSFQNKIMRFILACMLAGAMTGAAAATYPAAPITLIVPTGPGGGTDLAARALSERLAKALGQPVVIDNKAGAGGIIGNQSVARAKPDGYTLLISSNQFGIIPAIEAELRIGTAVNPSHYKRGWHATGTLGHFGAAMAASMLMKLNDQQIIAALGIAGTQACGMKEAFGTMTKPLHAGLAARNGVMAALLAARGFTSAGDILGGHYGFGAVASDDAAWDKPAWSIALADLSTSGRSWDLYSILYKTHASSFCTQALIEAVLGLRQEHGVQPHLVRAMHGQVSHFSIANARIAEPSTGMEAKFSLPHAMAQALSYGQARVEDFTDARANEPGLRSLRTRTTISEGVGLAWPEAIATIQTTSGTTLRQHVDLRQRTATAKDKWKVVEAKFMSITATALNPDQQNGIVRAVQGLEDASDIERLMTYIA